MENEPGVLSWAGEKGEEEGEGKRGMSELVEVRRAQVCGGASYTWLAGEVGGGRAGGVR